MQRDLRGQREAAFGDLSERAARKDTGHGITFFRICTFAYRVREKRTWYNIKPNLYVQLPCSPKRSNAPITNMRLQNRHGVLPNTVRELYMLVRCPKPKRGLCPLNTALHSAEIARLLAVFPSLTHSVKLQRRTCAYKA